MVVALPPEIVISEMFSLPDKSSISLPGSYVSQFDTICAKHLFKKREMKDGHVRTSVQTHVRVCSGPRTPEPSRHSVPPTIIRGAHTAAHAQLLGDISPHLTKSCFPFSQILANNFQPFNLICPRWVILHNNRKDLICFCCSFSSVFN